MSGLNTHVKILLAAVQLEERGKIPFTEEELVIESWKRYPDDFGMCGMSVQYPDSHSVIWKLIGKKGLFFKSLLKKIPPNSIVLTAKGRELAYDVSDAMEVELGRAIPTPLPAANGLSKLINCFLNHVIDSQAFHKYHFLEKERISIGDAEILWSLPPKAQGELIPALLDEFKDKLEEVRRIMKGTNGELTLHNGRAITWEDVARVSEVDSYLRYRFTKTLKLLQMRR